MINPLSPLLGSIIGKVALGAVAVLAVWGGVQTYRLNSLEADVAIRVAVAEKARADAEAEQRRIAGERRKDREQALKDIAEAKDENQDRMAKLELLLARYKLPQISDDVARIESSKLRDQLATERLAGQAGRDSATACNLRAAAYEQKLTDGDRIIQRFRAFGPQCLRVAGVIAKERDDFAGEVVNLVKHYPK